MDNIKFGNFVKGLRIEKGLTQKELGEKLNITDKAISKWERGESFPDVSMLNSLAETLDVEVGELLNGERGVKEEDVDKKIEEAINKYKEIEKEKNKKKDKIFKVLSIISMVIFTLAVIGTIGYLVILKPRGYEYIKDSFLYIVNEIILVTGTMSILYLLKLHFKKINSNNNKKENVNNNINNNVNDDKTNKNININIVKGIAIGIFCTATFVNVLFMILNGFDNKCIVSVSKDLSSTLVLKEDRDTGELKVYYHQILFFAKEKESLQYEVEGKIKKDWLTNDVCSITYLDRDGNLREYVATFGDRGDGISYYYVVSALSGDWQVSTRTGSPTQLLEDSKGIRIIKNGKTEQFEHSEIKQFGTIAIVLYDEEVPRYVVALDENCKIDDKTDIILKGGTITISEVSMDKKKHESLYCMTYKDEEGLDNYSSISISKNDYKIRNGIMYISYDGKEIVEIPGDFTDMIEYEDGTYQISDIKTVFYYNVDKKRYLVYSDDKGKNWNTVEIPANYGIQSLQFVSKDVGYMLKFDDVAVSRAFGDVARTTDGGKTWTDVFPGFGMAGEKMFNSGSKIFFATDKIGFLSMPEIMGTYTKMYKTTDGGDTFEEMNVSDSDIYDTYELPYRDGKNLILEIGQGTDGTYNGGDSTKYISYDDGLSWTKIK